MGLLKIEEAQKFIKPLKIYMYAPTFAGKTYSSLLLLNGIIQEQHGLTEAEAWEHILIVDTEYGRASNYSSLGKFKMSVISKPYSIDKLGMIADEVANMKDIYGLIIDGMTPFWSKEGGALDMKVQYDAQGGNSYSNWQKITSILDPVLTKLLDLPIPVIFTARSKNDTALISNAKGKIEPKTFGLKPDFRDNFDYECDLVVNIDKEDNSIFLDKGLVGMEKVYPPITTGFGKDIYKLSIDNAVAVTRGVDEVCTSIRKMCAGNNDLITYVGNELSGKKMESLPINTLIELENKVISMYKKAQTVKKK